MDIADKNKPALAKSLMCLSGVGVIFAAFGALGLDIFMASSQWLLVSIMLGVWSLYVLMEAGVSVRK